MTGLFFCIWNFVKEHILDFKGGKWVWGVDENYTLTLHEDKVGT